MSYFFGNIFSKLTSSVCNTIQAKLLCSRILRFKCVEIFEVISILSELKDSVHNIRRLANIYKPQSKEIQCISGELIFHLHSLRVFQIQICSFTVQGTGSAHYIGYSAKGTFSTKHPYRRTVGKLRFNKRGKYKLI